MARRKVTSDQRKSLAEALRLSSRDGSFQPGSLLPTVRELSELHNLSRRIVSKELQTLVDEGILYTVPRVGTFVGRPVTRLTDFYLLLYDRPTFVNRIRIGFEERIAELGASSLVMPYEEAMQFRLSGKLPPLSGVFDFIFRPNAPVAWPRDENVAYVVYASLEPPDMTTDSHQADTVHLDNVGGGLQATQHLLQLGHQQIAFLGLHNPANQYTWSGRREDGWRMAMAAAGVDSTGLSFLPSVELADDASDERWRIEDAARALASRRDVTAVVCANDWAAMALFDALRDANIAEIQWPSVVGFDNLQEAERNILTSMRVPWEDLGRTAAHTLFQRKMGALQGPPVERIIPLKLIPRLSSRQLVELGRVYSPGRAVKSSGLTAPVT